MTMDIRKQSLLVLFLAALMAFTRFNHFGSSVSLPDASIAIFFLAGLSCRQRAIFALLVIEAGMIDYLAISPLSVNDFCLTPAYLCLIPTYAIVWLAGRQCVNDLSLDSVNALKIVGLATLGIIAAFILSNGSFYLLSGSFGSLSRLSWDRYWHQALEYGPAYVSVNLIYVMSYLAVVKLYQTAQIRMAVESQ